MNRPYMDGDHAAEMLERRWFATYKLAETMRAECEAMRAAMLRSHEAWLRAQSQLAEFEILRDALGDELAALAEREGAAPFESRRIMTAA